MTIELKWDAPELQVQSDTRWRAQYRALQSWYREKHLGAPPGIGGKNRLVGSMIDEITAGKQPHLNFLTPEIARYVEKRIPEVQAAEGTIEVDRLRRNLLSSMPLAFNLFGFLRSVPSDAAPVLAKVLSLDVSTITQIEVEWSPPSSEHLGDRTAFDAFIEYRRGDGTMAFIGVETKYTEPFSTTEYERPMYVEMTTDPASGFKPGAEVVLKESETNQLWRNCLLALSLRSKNRYAAGHVLVLACRGDAGAEKAVRGLEENLVDPRSILRNVALEDFIAPFTRLPVAAEWAQAFERRYLDLTPVEG